MKVRSLVVQAAAKLNLIPAGANLSGTDTQIMCGLLRDVLDQYSTDNAFNNRATLVDADGKGKDFLTIGIPLDDHGRPYDLSKMTEEEIQQLKADHPEVDILSPRPFNVQAVYVSSGSNWVKCNETSLAALPSVTFPGNTNIPQFCAYEQTWPLGKIRFNRGFSGRVRLVYSLPFPEFDINSELDITPEYNRAIFWELVLAGACFYGFQEQMDEAKAMRDETVKVVEKNNEKSRPIDFTEQWNDPFPGGGLYPRSTIINMC